MNLTCVNYRTTHPTVLGLGFYPIFRSRTGAIMQQAKFSLTPDLINFLSNYEFYGFKDKSAMVRAALLRFQEEIELESLTQSADLYAELYAEDSDLFELTEAGSDEWPE